MKVTLIAGKAGLLEELRKRVEDAGFEVLRALLRKDGESLSVLLAEIEGDLLIVESPDLQLAEDIAAVARVNTAHPSLSIFMVSTKRDSDTLTAAMRAGIREVLASPLNAEELAGALHRLAQRNLQMPGTGKPRRGKVITCYGIKGGSGATFLATNMAYLLANEHFKNVALIDFNFYVRDASFFMTDSPDKGGFFNATRQIDRLDGRLLGAIMTKLGPHLSVLSAPEALQDSLSINADEIKRVLELARESYDFVVLDVDLTLMVRDMIQILDESDLVFPLTTNTIPGIRAAKRFLDHNRAFEVPNDRVRLVINMFDKNYPIKLDQIEKALGVKVAYTIPNSVRQLEAENAGVALITLAPKDPAVRALRAIVEDLAGKPASKGRAWFPF